MTSLLIPSHSSPPASRRPRFLSVQDQAQQMSRPRSNLALNTTNPLEPISEHGAASSGHGSPFTSSMTRHESLMLDGGPTKQNGSVNNHPFHVSQPISPSSRRLSLDARLASLSLENLTHSMKFDNLRTSIRDRTGYLRSKFGGSRRIRNRLIQKHGESNISLVNVPKQTRRFFSDIFTTIVEVKWRWCLLMFSMSYVLSWLLFTVVYYLILLAHGDFDHVDDEKWTHCIMNIKNFISVFLFSLESQSTIGYGFRYPSEECPEVVVIVCFQNIIGVMIQTLMAGVVFAKLARPKKRAETIIFSKNAVICMRDGQLCFLFRVGDMRKSHLAEAHLRLQLIKKRITAEGELLPFHQYDMDVGYDAGLDRVFVIWPITICHVIDEDSPLYDVSKDDLTDGARFEIIAILEGVVESTGSTAQAKTSYLPNEISWGHRFDKLVTYQRDNGEYRIDFSKFNTTYETQCPSYSAKQLDDMKDKGLNPERSYQWLRVEDIENGGQTPYATIHHDQSIDPRPSILDNTDSNGTAPLLERARAKLTERRPTIESTTEEDEIDGTSQIPIIQEPEIVVKSESTSQNIKRSASPERLRVLDQGRKQSRKRSVLKEHDLM